MSLHGHHESLGFDVTLDKKPRLNLGDIGVQQSGAPFPLFP